VVDSQWLMVNSLGLAGHSFMVDSLAPPVINAMRYLSQDKAQKSNDAKFNLIKGQS